MCRIDQLQEQRLAGAATQIRATRLRADVAESAPEHGRGLGFQHESLFYSGPDEFLAGTIAPIDQALERGQRVLVAVRRGRLALLREALGERAARVRLLDMCVLGRNPARIIPAWRQFLDTAAPLGAPALGIGELTWPGRSAAELSECERHETLLNLAFAGEEPWRLLCPYDLDGLEDAVIEAARRNHPSLAANGTSERNALYRDQGREIAFGGGLPRAPGHASERSFSLEQLRMVRHLVADRAEAALLPADRTEELVLAVSELAGNSVRHGGGEGRVRVWQENGTLLCEVQDEGRIDAPLTGRVRPRPEQLSGRGLWLVNQLCDLVQIRSGSTGTVVRVHMDVIAPAARAGKLDVARNWT